MLKKPLTKKDMDKRTAYYLDKIGRSIPKELLRKGMKTVKDGGQIHEMMEYVAKKSGDKKLQALVKKGEFLEKDRQVMDRAGDKEIQSWVDQKVESEIKRGTIKKANKDELREWNPSQGS